MHNAVLRLAGFLGARIKTLLCESSECYHPGMHFSSVLGCMV